MNTPLLMWGDEVQHYFRVAIATLIVNGSRGFQIDRWSIACQRLAKGNHPWMIKIELLPAGKCAPRDQFVHIGITSVVTHRLAFDTTPGRAANDLARLCLNIVKADLFIFAMYRQMSVIAPSDLA